ncbi:Oxidoreductase, molybdopterin-binding domain-containing protein [Hyaloraphidium curvatum]|nr:Oxidoreductase, molybdopterin-binding domain-containing protein [Hyaloraphidium curvatum]
MASAAAATRTVPRNPFVTTNPPKGHSPPSTFTAQEVMLANRNYGQPSETLRLARTPTGLHYTLNHFDVHVFEEDADSWELEVGGMVRSPRRLTLHDIRDAAKRSGWERTIRVVLECAGNGRASLTAAAPPEDTGLTLDGGFAPKWPSMPWTTTAASTADWTGMPLSRLLVDMCGGLEESAVDLVFYGADFGHDGKCNMHYYARSLPADMFGPPDPAKPRPSPDDILVCWAMNGAPLLPQHGFPLRLVVPGFYGCASVKWLTSICAIGSRFLGHQMMGTYITRQRAPAVDPGVPVDFIRVRSLWAPAGVVDWYTRTRLVFVNLSGATQVGKAEDFALTGKAVPAEHVVVPKEDVAAITVRGRAWVGSPAVPRTRVVRVEVSSNGGETWDAAELGSDSVPPPDSSSDLVTFSWVPFSYDYKVRVPDKAEAPLDDSYHRLLCRAIDSEGRVQPTESPWDWQGFAKNGADALEFWLRFI